MPAGAPHTRLPFPTPASSQQPSNLGPRPHPDTAFDDYGDIPTESGRHRLPTMQQQPGVRKILCHSSYTLRPAARLGSGYQRPSRRPAVQRARGHGHGVRADAANIRFVAISGQLFAVIDDEGRPSLARFRLSSGAPSGGAAATNRQHLHGVHRTTTEYTSNDTFNYLRADSAYT